MNPSPASTTVAGWAVIRSGNVKIIMKPQVPAAHYSSGTTIDLWPRNLVLQLQGLAAAAATREAAKRKRHSAGHQAQPKNACKVPITFPEQLGQRYAVLRLQGLAAAAATREAAKRKGHSAEDQGAPKKARRVPIISHEVAIPKAYVAKDLSEELHGEPCSFFDPSFPDWAADFRTMQRLDRSA